MKRDHFRATLYACEGCAKFKGGRQQFHHRHGDMHICYDSLF